MSLMPRFLILYLSAVLLMMAVARGAFCQDLDGNVPSTGSAQGPVQSRADSGVVAATADGIVGEQPTEKTLATGQAGSSDRELVGRPLMTVKHFAAVRIVEFSPDGKYIASVGAAPENWIRISDAATGQLVRVLKGHTFDVTTLAFSPNGKLLATAGHDQTMRVWDVEAGHELFRLEDQGSGVSLSLIFTLDGKSIIGGSTLRDRNFRVWSASTGREIRRIPADRSLTPCLTLSPDGQRIACVHGPNALSLIDIEGGETAKVLNGHTVPTQGVIFSPDGKLIASCAGNPPGMNPGDGEVKLWDADSGREIRALARSSAGFLDLAFSPDGKRLATISRDHLVKVWDVETGRELMSFKAHGVDPPFDGSPSVAFSTDGKRIVSCGADRYVRVWDANQVELVAVGDPPPPLAINDSNVAIGQQPARYLRDIECVAFSPDGRRVVSGASDGEIKVSDTDSGHDVLTLQSHMAGLYYIRINQVAYSPDGKLIISCGDDGKLRLWKAESGELVQTLGGQPGIQYGEAPVLSVAFSPDGTRIFSCTGMSKSVFRVWETGSGSELFSRNYDASELNDDVARFVTFSSDGQQFLIGCDFKTILLDAGTGQPIRDLDGVSSNGTKAAFSPDGRRVVSTAAREIAIVDTVTGKQIVKVSGPVNTWVRSRPVFSPDGKTFATGGFAGSISLWDAATGKELARNFDETGPIAALAFSPDGKFLVSGSARLRAQHDPGTTLRDGEIQLWDAATGEMLRTFVRQPPANVP